MTYCIDRQVLKELLIYIAALIAVIILFSWLLQIVNAQPIIAKNATMTVYKGEMVWCVFGNPQHTNPICNSLELKNNPHLIDQFLQFLENGPTIVYKK